MTNKSLLSMNLDELLAFSLIEANRHTNITESVRRFSINLCRLLKGRHQTYKLEILRSLLSIIRFCNVHLCVSHESKYKYYCDKINKLLLNINTSIKEMDEKTNYKKIKAHFRTLIMELDHIKFEEEINKEFIYPMKNKSEEVLKKENSESIQQINEYFDKLPKEESKLFEFFGI